MTQEYLKSLLHYNKDTGAFTRLVRCGSRGSVGSVAGFVTKEGYHRIKIDGKAYGGHQLAFLYMIGNIPSCIDHKDHVCSNNAWSNIRPVTNSENSKNLSIRYDNMSGFSGVYFDKVVKRKPWKASIRCDNKQIHLGYFDTKDEAIAARKAANIKYGFHENHGK